MESPRPSFAAVAVTLGGIALLAGLVLAIPDLRDAFEAAVRGDTDEVRRRIDDLGVTGPLLILALALIHTVVFYPAEILDAAAGFAYGFFPALALMMSGWLLSGLLCFAVGHRVARPLLDRWFGTERFERTEAAIERGGVTLLLAVRLIPIIPFSLVSYAAGAARVPVWRFMDDHGRLPAADGPLGLLRHPPRGPQPHRPAGLGQRHRPAGPAPPGPPHSPPRLRPEAV